MIASYFIISACIFCLSVVRQEGVVDRKLFLPDQNKQTKNHENVGENSKFMVSELVAESR